MHIDVRNFIWFLIGPLNCSSNLESFYSRLCSHRHQYINSTFVVVELPSLYSCNLLRKRVRSSICAMHFITSNHGKWQTGKRENDMFGCESERVWRRDRDRQRRRWRQTKKERKEWNQSYIVWIRNPIFKEPNRTERELKRDHSHNILVRYSFHMKCMRFSPLYSLLNFCIYTLNCYFNGAL